MAYNEKLAGRIHKRLANLPHIEEKKMMGGLTFMYHNKMCVGIIREEMMCRIDPALYRQALEKPGCRPLDFTRRPMTGFVLVAEERMKSKADFEYRIGLALDFNKKAKSSKKK